MRKRLLSILLLCCMVLTLLPTAALAEETAPTFDLTKDLEGITIPADLVTCICTKTNESRSYGQLPGGFSASPILKEDGFWTVIIYVVNPIYKAEFDKDMGCEHKQDPKYSTDFINQIHFKLKYEENKWELLGEMPQNKMLHFTCSGGHVYQGDIPVIELVTRTGTDIKVTENSAWEYSIDNGNSWQRSCLFKDLSPGTKYSIIARVKETATHKPSANSAPLLVTTMHLDISDELEGKLRAVASAYKGEYDGNEHEAVIVDTTNLPTGWTIAGYTTDGGKSFGNSIPRIKDAGTLNVGVKFTHPDYLMNITYYYTAEVKAKPLTTITEDDLVGLNIPANLVTVKCQTTGDSKAYGKIHGGFTLGKPYMENGVWKAIVQLNLPAYKAKYDTDTKKTHEIADLGGNLVTTFTLKYVNDKWELEGTFPNVVILVKCDGQHPQTPPYPTEENVSGLEQVQVRVQCSTDTAQFKNYGILPGGVSIMPDANDPSQATLTLIPSVYSTQYSTDTGITHIADPNQTADNLKIQMHYDPAEGKWMPAGELTPLVIYVKCNNHQGQRYTITFNGNGGTPSVTSMTTIDQKLPELPTATHSGSYSFDGWYTAASGGTKITTATVFHENTTVYAHWIYTGGGGGWYYTYYTIKATAGTNGSISPSGWTSVRDGWDQTFTITPDKGYAVAKVLVDGKSVGSVKSYTFKNVTKDHTIEAIFMKSNGNPATGVFVDVAEGSYYEEAVDWAVENGITTGTGNNYFTPDGICTRVQAVTFLRRAMAE